MANFFNFFPKTPYILEKNGELTLTTNIITRIKFLDKIKNTISAYYSYDISEGETPESLAYKFYGMTQRHWIILLFNNIIDPQYDWFLDENSFKKYVDKKYENFGGYSYAQNNIKSYYKKIKKTVNFTQNPTITYDVVEIDLETYTSIFTTPIADYTVTIPNTIPYYKTIITATFSTSIFTKTYLDYEIEENLKKKTIKILRKEYIDQVEKELENITQMKIKSSI